MEKVNDDEETYVMRDVWNASRKQALDDCIKIAMRYAQTSYQANVIAKDIENLDVRY